jgi:hypothetical protein
LIARIAVPIGGVGWKRRDDQIGPAVAVDVIAERSAAEAPARGRIVRFGGTDLVSGLEIRPRIPLLIGDEIEMTVAIDVEHGNPLGAKCRVQRAFGEPRRARRIWPRGARGGEHEKEGRRASHRPPRIRHSLGPFEEHALTSTS